MKSLLSTLIYTFLIVLGTNSIKCEFAYPHVICNSDTITNININLTFEGGFEPAFSFAINDTADPYAVDRINDHPINKISELLPHNWKKNQLQRTAEQTATP